ncbi:putative transcription initiation factor IIA large subunit [Amylocarpus encephaloides]|uniref:Transcription initiation factor IIA large subunit n=1 Tax=Amylocarpus encephaloides TaxID=45428 RepID=A0A9P7YMI7_9HELO|nr:putative transcription initiation factor IIA large subunit [Amylocarpus encephaloides]
MSNAQVGNVYQQIIADVIESSRVDFEEGGVDASALDELRQVRVHSHLQRPLPSNSLLHVVATFPWDPKPEPPQAIVQPPTVPSNAGSYMNNSPNGQPQPMPQMHPINNHGNVTRIKPDPGMENPAGGQGPYQSQPLPAIPNATPAQQRAAQHLQNSYGQRAAASINAIQGAAQQPGNAQPNMQQHMQMQQQRQMQMQQQQLRGGPMPPQMAARPSMSSEQYKQAIATQTQQKNQLHGGQSAQPQNGPHIKVENGLNAAQTDGAGDEDEVVGLVKQFNENGEEIGMARVEIDGLIRQKIEVMGQKMEGGGLMLPLKQASTPSKRQRKVARSAASDLAQHDGPGSDDDKKDDDFDEDAINSDLDDPDDGLNDEEDDDEGMGHIMLCMYDKVQRVKNKWKCVMKDGVLTVNGKEYVFHKAQGEYEW